MSTQAGCSVPMPVYEPAPMNVASSPAYSGKIPKEGRLVGTSKRDDDAAIAAKR